MGQKTVEEKERQRATCSILPLVKLVLSADETPGLEPGSLDIVMCTLTQVHQHLTPVFYALLKTQKEHCFCLLLVFVFASLYVCMSVLYRLHIFTY